MQAYDAFCDSLNFLGRAVIPSFVLNTVDFINKQSGVPQDQIRFLLICLAVYPIGLLFRSLPNATSKHLFGIIVSVWVGNFLVAHQWIHTLISSLVCYLMLLVFGPKARHAVFAFSLAYLCSLHIYRQWTDYLGWTFDVTMQMMIVIQKLSILGYSYYDGTENPKPTEEQRRFSISGIPGILEFLGWIYMPTNFPMGPTFEFVEYRNCAEGKLPAPPIHLGLILLGQSLVLLLIYQVSLGYVSVDLLRDPTFLNNSVLKIYVVSLLVALFIRLKYYFGFKVAEGAAMMGGLGHSNSKIEKWDGMTNMNILQFELSQSYRDSSSAWNIKTSLWLRRLVYERLPSPINLYAVYFLSAFWHGFYPGYYMFFLTIGILTGVHRKIRDTLRPRAIAMGPTAKKIYDVIGWVVTIGTRDYYILSFMLLEFSASVRLYKSMLFFIHVLSAVSLVVFYSGFVKPPKKQD